MSKILLWTAFEWKSVDEIERHQKNEFIFLVLNYRKCLLAFEYLFSDQIFFFFLSFYPNIQYFFSDSVIFIYVSNRFEFIGIFVRSVFVFIQ